MIRFLPSVRFPNSIAVAIVFPNSLTLSLSNSIYGSLNLFRGLLQTHPKAKEIKIPYDNTQYYVV